MGDFGLRVVTDFVLARGCLLIIMKVFCRDGENERTALDLCGAQLPCMRETLFEAARRIEGLAVESVIFAPSFGGALVNFDKDFPCILVFNQTESFQCFLFSP